MSVKFPQNLKFIIVQNMDHLQLIRNDFTDMMNDQKGYHWCKHGGLHNLSDRSVQFWLITPNFRRLRIHWEETSANKLENKNTDENQGSRVGRFFGILKLRKLVEKRPKVASGLSTLFQMQAADTAKNTKVFDSPLTTFWIKFLILKVP